MYGFAAPRVLPLAGGPRFMERSTDEALMKRLQDGRRNLLMSVVTFRTSVSTTWFEAFAHYLRFDPEARLVLVGNGDAEDPYVRFLQETMDRHAVREHVLLAGHVSAGELQRTTGLRICFGV